MQPSRRTRARARPRTLTAAAVLAGAALAAAAPAGAATTVTFLSTGAQQQFVVPAGVTSLHVLAVGGRGGNGLAPGGGLGGAPAEAAGDVTVFPGQTLYVEVGGAGTDASFGGIARAFNGGTFGGEGGAGGGGASDVRLLPRPEPDTPQSLFSRLLVAGGGGGGGAGSEGTLGGAGGNAGSAGASANKAVGGGAGTEEAGGIGPCPERGCDGKLGSGAAGIVGLAGSQSGGGGGGLFGGAAGGTNAVNTGAGGGGGSSLHPAGGSTVVPAVLGAPAVQISYVPPAPAVTKPPPAAPAISNSFVLLRPIVGSGRSITLVLDLPGPGTLKATATSTREVVVRKHGRRIRRKVRFTFGTAPANVRAGALELTIAPTKAGRRALAAHKRLPVSLAVTFSPTGGKPATRKLNLTLPRR